jgi:hypothetical protein
MIYTAIVAILYVLCLKSWKILIGEKNLLDKYKYIENIEATSNNKLMLQIINCIPYLLVHAIRKIN